MKIFSVILFMLLAFTTYVAAKPPENIGATDGHLSKCPKSPNCVCSDAIDKEHKIAPLPYQGKDSLDKIEKFIKEKYKGQIVTKNSSYLHMVVKSKLFHFKDDLEFLVDPQKNQIAVRSAAQIGHSDFNVNRKRIEEIRKGLAS